MDMALNHNFVSVLSRNVDYLVPRLNHQVHFISGSFFARPLKTGKINVYYFHGRQSLKRLGGYIVPVLEMFLCLPVVNFYFYRRLTHQAKNIQL